MMTSVSGRRGIGKTYHLSKEVYRRYKQNFLIITNFSHIYSNIDCSYMTPDDFIELLIQLLVFKDRGYELNDLFPSFQHSGVFIAIDEGHLYFSADLYKRYQSNASFQNIIKLLAQARKQDIEIWYTCQTPDKIDKNWRRYTDDYILYKPVIPFRSKIRIPHKTKPIYRNEVRYWIPILWEEHHELQAEDPTFNSSFIERDGSIVLSPQSTLRTRSLVLSGWMNPYPYTLYNSNQVVATRTNNEADFHNLLELGVVNGKYGPNHFPTFKKALGFPTMEIPTRIRVEPESISLEGKEDIHHNTILQDTKIIENWNDLTEQLDR